MYVPKIFSPPSPDHIRKYIEENEFATLIGISDGNLIGTHIPLQFKGEDLVGHISIANHQKQCFSQDKEMLAIFMEHHAYVSSSWYDHINVPTWNYIAVHIYGKPDLLNEEEKLKSLESLVERYEGQSSQPFHMSQMSDRDLKAQLRGIVAFKLKITRIEASWKMSQNRNDRDFNNIISKLRERGDQLSTTIADEMEGLRL